MSAEFIARATEATVAWEDLGSASTPVHFKTCANHFRSVACAAALPGGKSSQTVTPKYVHHQSNPNNVTNGELDKAPHQVLQSGLLQAKIMLQHSRVLPQHTKGGRHLQKGKGLLMQQQEKINNKANK